MPIIQLSDKDILRSKVVTPGWYRVRIEGVGEKASKDGGSTNYPVEATIIKEADTGSDEYANVPLDWNFNSKAIGFTVGFLAAIGVDAEAGKRYDLAHSATKELEVYVENELYQGNMKNRVNHKYRPLRETVGA